MFLLMLRELGVYFVSFWLCVPRTSGLSPVQLTPLRVGLDLAPELFGNPHFLRMSPADIYTLPLTVIGLRPPTLTVSCVPITQIPDF